MNIKPAAEPGVSDVATQPHPLPRSGDPPAPPVVPPDIVPPPHDPGSPALPHPAPEPTTPAPDPGPPPVFNG
jgi:hypothetical protein